MKRTLPAAILAVLAVLLAAPALRAGDSPEGKWWKNPRVTAELGLSPDQETAIEKIFVHSRPKLIDLRGDLEKKQFDLRQALEHDADRAEVERKLDTVEAARRDLQKTRVLMLVDMRNVLKPEQWERLKQMREELRERRRDGRQGGGDAPQRPNRPNGRH